MEQKDIASFLKVLEGDKYGRLYQVTLFTGLRQGEVLGLTWDCVDFDRCTLYINKQLQKTKKVGGDYALVPTKNSRGRIVMVAGSVIELLKEEKRWQEQKRELAGSAWDNSWNLVFTNELGRHLCHVTVYKHFKETVKKIGLPEERFHDLRHPYVKHATKKYSLQKQKSQATISDNLRFLFFSIQRGPAPCIRPRFCFQGTPAPCRSADQSMGRSGR